MQTIDVDFTRAPAVFPNNDIMYEVNKRRADIYVYANGLCLTWCPAKDRPNTWVLNEKPNITEEKVVWLQRHDKDCGDLYGLLPLAMGLPVTLTDHVDRNPEINLLRGRIGYVDGWVLADSEDSKFSEGRRILRHMLTVVFVQFKERISNDGEMVYEPCRWRNGQSDKRGVILVSHWKRSWFLDKGSTRPVLDVKRQQVPLAPAYSITAHGAQGQTLPAAIVDSQLGRGVGPIARHVAMTRARRW